MGNSPISFETLFNEMREKFEIPMSYPEDVDFRVFLKQKLNDYIAFLERYDSFVEEYRMQVNQEDRLMLFRNKKPIECATSIVDSILQAIEHYYNGRIASAYELIEKLLVDNRYIFYQKYSEFGLDDTSFYRLRKSQKADEIFESVDKLFHVSFEKRGKIKTARYSVSGLPALYLGTSLYVCWEEMERQDIRLFWASKFNIQNIEKHSLAILSMYRIDDFEKKVRPIRNVSPPITLPIYSFLTVFGDIPNVNSVFY